MLNLWATWCAPCVKELPTLNRIANRADVGVEVVTVSQDMGEPEAVQRFLDERGLAPATAEIEQERKVAIYDLLEENSFALPRAEALPGPYRLGLSVREGRLAVRALACASTGDTSRLRMRSRNS